MAVCDCTAPGKEGRGWCNSGRASLTCHLSPQQRPAPSRAGSVRTPRPNRRLHRRRRRASQAVATTARTPRRARPRSHARPGTRRGCPSVACPQARSRRARAHSCPWCCSIATACWHGAGRWGALRRAWPAAPPLLSACCGPGTQALQRPRPLARRGLTTWAPRSSSPTAGDEARLGPASFPRRRPSGRTVATRF